MWFMLVLMLLLGRFEGVNTHPRRPPPPPPGYCHGLPECNPPAKGFN